MYDVIEFVLIFAALLTLVILPLKWLYRLIEPPKAKPKTGSMYFLTENLELIKEGLDHIREDCCHPQHAYRRGIAGESIAEINLEIKRRKYKRKARGNT